MEVQYRMSMNSTILEKTSLPRQLYVSTLSGEIKNKRDFDAADSVL